MKWSSYDPVAATYERLSVPLIFTKPAKDLVAMLAVSLGSAVLDVGAGTGAATVVALQAAGPGSRVVALDHSPEMLGFAVRKGVRRAVVGKVPGLPMRDASFDRVMANFVLSHTVSYQAALRDMVRVLRPGGKLGFSAWGPGQDEFRKLWQAKAESFIGKEELERGVREALPWEEWFSDGSHLEEALREAGLEAIEVNHHNYKVRVTSDDFLAMRDLTFPARLMSKRLNAAQWGSFRESVRSEFRRRFGGSVEDTRDAFLAAGTKPQSEAA